MSHTVFLIIKLKERKGTKKITKAYYTILDAIQHAWRQIFLKLDTWGKIAGVLIGPTPRAFLGHVKSKKLTT